MSVVAEGLNLFIEQLADAGIPVTDDPRNLRTGAVIVDSPSITALTNDVVELRIPCVAVVPPPGNKDAMGQLIALVDELILAAGSATTITAEPGVYPMGSVDLPAYRTTITISYRRD